MHAGTQVPPALHVTVPPAGGMHTVHAFPHEAMLVLPLTTHRAPHVLPTQMGLPLAGSLQAAQPIAVQPDATVLLATQVLPQR